MLDSTTTDRARSDLRDSSRVEAETEATRLTTRAGLELLVSGPRPSSGPESILPPLVSVHGVARNHHEHARAFAGLCQALGVPLIVPHFDGQRFKGYQRIKRGSGISADQALLEALDECHERFGWPSSCRLFGFSGGAQFAHRFVLAHGATTRDTSRPAAPVERLALASAGFYTMPDPTVAYPEGLAPSALTETMDVERLLAVPTRLFVGERDTERDSDLRVSARLDRLQGKDRFERAQRFGFAIRAAAAMRRMPLQCGLVVLRDCGHSFRRCVRHGSLDRLVLTFLYPELSSRIAALEGSLLTHGSNGRGLRP